MSETTTQVQDVQEGNVITFQPTSNPFAEETWADKPVLPEKKEGPDTTVIKPETAPINEEKKDEFVDADEWLKQNYGWENAETGKKELEELRKLKETAQTPAEIKFANDQSQKFFDALKEGKEDEVYEFLNRKRELSQVDKLKAEEIIRLNIKYANPHFKDADIHDVFEDQYAKPVKPVQEELEDEADYNVRVQNWQQQVEKIDRKIERDSFAAKQELAKYNSELVLPDIPKVQPEIQQTVEDPELDAKIALWKEQVFQKMDNESKNFNGFNATYKDEAVEIPVAFTMTDEERGTTLKLLKEKVIGQDYNFNNYFNQRWFDETGNPKVEQMMADVYLMNNPEKVFQKFVNEAATKRLEHKMKADSNIVINPATPQGTFNPDNRTEPQKLQEFFWNQ